MSLETSNISKLLKIFEKNQNNIAITDTLRDNKITYKEFLNKSLDILQYLKEKKIQVGDKILISLENSYDFLILIFACLLGGFIAVPIDPNLPSERLIKLKKMIKPNYNKKIDLNYSNKKIKKKLSFSKRPFYIIHIWDDW